MAKLPYIKEYTDDCGIRRRYFRRKGFKGGVLPGRLGSAEFLAAYQGYITGSTAEIKIDRSATGTFGGLIADYYQSIEYANLKRSSKRLYRYALEPLREQHGHRPVQTMTRDNLVGIIERLGARAPGMANLTRAVLQKMLKVALDRGRIASNPLAQKLTAYKSGSHHTWTDAELAQFEARWPLGSRQRLAFALLFYTGQRTGDVVRMGRADITAGAIRVVQEKTGVELSIQIHPDLLDALKAGPTKGLNLIGDAYGRPIKRAALSHLMRQAIRAAGLPARCVPHGIRKATLRTMAEHGASAKQLAAVSGHKTTKELDRYTAAADQPTLAGAGIASLPIRR
jgi:enterobacteria phage integrase